MAGSFMDLISPVFVAGIAMGIKMGMLLERDILSKNRFNCARNFFIAGVVVALSFIISDQHFEKSLVHESYKDEREDFLTLLNGCKTDFDELMEEKEMVDQEFIELKNDLETCQNGSSSEVDDNSSEESSYSEESALSGWFHAMLTRDENGNFVCPFTSSDDARLILKTSPDWSNLNKMDAKEKRRFLTELSLFFHPDKMASIGCSQSYGNDALTEINLRR